MFIDLSAPKGATINNEDITVTANNTYTASEGYTGLGTVVVNVPQVFKPELTNLKTIYKSVQNSSGDIVTDVLYPNGTKNDVLIWNANTTTPLGGLVGFLLDEELITVTQIRFDMSVNVNATGGSVYLFGYAGTDYAKRFSCPVGAITNENKINFYFSADGTTWSSSVGLSDVIVNNNENTLIGFELAIENGEVVKRIYKNDILVYTQNTGETAFVLPTDKTVGIFTRLSSSGYWNLSNIHTDMTKLKITVNNTVIVDGAELN